MLLLNLVTFLVALTAPVMILLEVYFGFNFPLWSFVAPVSVAVALFIAVIVHALLEDGDVDG